jgi:hypothetical protein
MSCRYKSPTDRIPLFHRSAHSLELPHRRATLLQVRQFALDLRNVQIGYEAGEDTEVLMYKVSQCLFELPDVYCPVAAEEGAVPFLIHVLSDPSLPDTVFNPSLSLAINLLYGAPALIPVFAEAGIFESVYRRMAVGDPKSQKYIAIFLANSMLEDFALRAQFVAAGFYDEFLTALKQFPELTLSTDVLIPLFAISDFPLTVKQKAELFYAFTFLIQFELFNTFLDAVLTFLETEDPTLRKGFFDDLDFPASVFGLIPHENMALLVKALETCLRILKTSPATFSLARIPMQRIVRLALTVDFPQVAVGANEVLSECVTLGRRHAISNLSEHKYFSFVVENNLSDLTFDVKRAIAAVCWNALSASRTSQFEAFLKVGLVSRLIEQLDPSDCASVRQFLGVVEKAVAHGWAGVLVRDYETIAALWGGVEEGVLQESVGDLLARLEAVEPEQVGWG